MQAEQLFSKETDLVSLESQLAMKGGTMLAGGNNKGKAAQPLCEYKVTRQWNEHTM